MNKLIGLIAASFVLLAQPAIAQTSADEAAVRRLAYAFGEAWNQHDAAKLVSNMAPEAEFITAGARRLIGRQNIEKYHARLFRRSASASTNQTVEVALRFARPDVAMVHRKWTIRGDKYASGQARPERSGVMTMLAENRKGVWLVTSAQSTNVPAARRGEAQADCACSPR